MSRRCDSCVFGIARKFLEKIESTETGKRRPAIKSLNKHCKLRFSLDCCPWEKPLSGRVLAAKFDSNEEITDRAMVLSETRKALDLIYAELLYFVFKAANTSAG